MVSFITFIFIGLLKSLPFGLLFVNLYPGVWAGFAPKEQKQKVSKRTFLYTQLFFLLLGAVIFFILRDFLFLTEPISFTIFVFANIAIIIQFLHFFASDHRKLKQLNKAIYTLFSFALLISLFVYFIYPMMLTKELYAIPDVKVKKTTIAEQKNLDLMPIVTKGMTSIKADGVISSLENASYFTEGNYHLNNVDGKLVYLGDVEFDNFFKANRVKSTPGVISVSATDPKDEAILIKQKQTYAPSNYFNKHLKRVVKNAYPNKIILGHHLEAKSEGEFYYVVPLGHYKKAFTGIVPDSVAIVHPETGKTKKYDLQKLPKWIDRAIDEETAYTLWEYWGKNKNGWFNKSFIGPKRDVIVPNRKSLQITFNEDGDILYVTDFVRAREKGTATNMVGYGIFNARTGEMTYYKGLKGILTGEEAASSINASGPLSIQKGWKAKNTTFFNIYGAPTYVAPVVNSSNKLEGVAVMLGTSNNSKVVFGKTKEEAFREYRKELATLAKGNSASPSEDVLFTEVKGKVQRIKAVTFGGEETVFAKLEGDERLYMIPLSLDPESALTEPGDEVIFKVIETDETNVTVEEFVNMTMEKDLQ